MSDLVTVVTATVGHSGPRLGVLFRELSRFTQRPYRHIVCDDGTPFAEAVYGQQEACRLAGAVHLTNPGPEYGLTFNLNYALKQVGTPWALLVEDGVRPSQGWLETAVGFLEQIHGRSLAGYEVGMIGTAHLQDWMLVLGGAVPSTAPVTDFLHRPGPDTVRDFYGDWNDGYWCWERLLPTMRRRLGEPWASLPPPDPMLHNLRRIFWEGIGPVAAEAANENEEQQTIMKFSPRGRWPGSRRARVLWYPGPFLLIDMDKWRRVGRFRDHCTFFEGHLGIRMGQHEFLSLYLEFPPWLHGPGQCFRDVAAWPDSRRAIYPDVDALFREDFGGLGYADALAIPSTVIPKAAQEAADQVLCSLTRPVPAGWERYMEGW